MQYRHRASCLESSIGRRVGIAIGSMVLAGFGGCATPSVTSDLGVIARDAVTGAPLEGVRIVEPSDAAARTVVTTDSAGVAVFSSPAADSTWLLVRDGYEPVRVRLRSVEGVQAACADPRRGGAAGEIVIDGADLQDTGMLEVPLAPVTSRTLRVLVVDSITGAPVPDAEVVGDFTFVADRTGDLLSAPESIETRTDACGRALIDLPSASVCVLSIMAEGHAASVTTLDPASVEGIAAHTMIPLQAFRYEPTRVLVLDRATGLPVEGATIRIGFAHPGGDDAPHDSIWTTDAEGMSLVMKPSGGLSTMTVEFEGRAGTDFRVVEIHAAGVEAVAIGVDELD